MPSTSRHTQTSSTYEQERRWPRYEVDIPVRIVVREQERTTIRVGRATELSEGGMCLSAATELGVGAEIAVEFTPPYSAEAIRVGCDVRDRKGRRYGVEFVCKSKEEKHNLARLRQMLADFGSVKPS